MKINVQNLNDKKKFFSFEKSIKVFPAFVEEVESSSCKVLSPVKIGLDLYRVNDMYRGVGSVETLCRLQCSRCLKRFEISLRSDFALNFTRKPEQVNGGVGKEEYELNAEEAGLILFTGNEIDLLETIQDQLLMALPIRPLCRPDCLGLCPQCGADLNQKLCTCQKKVFNPKFQGLEKLKIDQDRNRHD